MVEKQVCWRDADDDVAVCFAGPGEEPFLVDAVRALAGAGVEPAWMRQVHSAVVADAVPGCAGRVDALFARREDLALAVVTADCVPVLLAAPAGRGRPRELAAVHAGWRGLAGGILGATLARFAPGSEIAAWIGPAIGRCCYEVGEDVARRVTAGLARAADEAGPSPAVHPGPAGRPHLDLRAVTEGQLRQGGVARIRHLDRCTRCEPRLASYRRDGRAAGRNLALIWIRR